MNILWGITTLYMILIFVRIILTWFSGAYYDRAAGLLGSVTDPYLNWFRRFSFLRLANIDLSPIVAIAALSVANNIFLALARNGRITVGIILAMVCSVLWSVLSFILNFLILILALRLAAYLTNRDVYHGFWSVIDRVSAPILYRINRIIFGRRLVRYMTSIIVSLGVLLILRVGLGFLAGLGLDFLVRLSQKTGPSF
jgi:YggT family protein